MKQGTPNTQSMAISTVRTQLNTLVNSVYRNETRVLVEKSGIPVAAIVSPADLERLARLDREQPDPFAVIDEIRQAFAGVLDEEIERETDRILGINQEGSAPIHVSGER